MLRKFISRKLLVAVGSMLIAIMVQAGIPETQATMLMDAIIWIASSYLLGQSAVDVAANLKA